MRFIRIIFAVITMCLLVPITGCEGEENAATEIIHSDPIDTYASTDNSSSTYADTYASTYADTFVSTYADTYASTGTYSSTDTYTSAGTYAGTDTYTSAGTYAGTEPGSDISISSDRNTDTGTFVDIDPERSSIPAQMSDYAMEEPIYVQGDQLTMDSSAPKLEGEIELNFIDYIIKTAIKARFTEKGMIEAQGNFLILYYSILNELNTDIQPATMINHQLYLMDDKGRRWMAADALETYDQISDDAAIEMGFSPPWLGLGSGLDDVTAIVFDIPTDAGHLKVVWEEVGLSISLD